MGAERYRLDSKDVIDLICEIETLLPVDEWIVDGFHLWPLLRIQLSFQLDSMVAKPMNARSSQHLRTAFKKITKVPNEIQRYYKSKSVDKSHNASFNKKIECFFYTYSSARRFHVDHKWYDVYCDPFISKLSDRNISSTVLEYTDHSGYRTPRFHPSQLEHPLLLYTLQTKAFANRSFSISNKLRQQILLYQRILIEHNIGQFFPDERSLRFRILMIRSYAEYFKKIFSNIESRISFGSNYYGFREMGMNLACSEIGINSVDIQHGVQGKTHIAYGRWTKVPSSGYELMPKIFWNWSEEEKSVIDEWGAATNGAHRSIVGGNPLMESFGDDSNELTQRFKSQVDSIIASSPTGISIHILVTLQPDVGINDILKNVFRNSPKHIYFWIRLHPNMLSNNKEILNQLTEIGNLQCNVKDATSLPLYALLKRMDGHITISSSTVIEAEYFNVPSIIIHRSGKEMYPKQIGNGIAVFAETPQEIFNAIESFQKNTGQSSYYKTSKMNKGLDELLRLAQ